MGLRTILVSGRDHRSLRQFASTLGPVDAMVAENGAVVEAPLGGKTRAIGRAIALQIRRRLDPLSGVAIEYGMIVVSCAWTERRIVRSYLSGLDVAFLRNRDRLMVLPTGITKASGLAMALRRLGIDRHSFAAIGDGENDLSMLRAARLSGAVANAIPSVRSAVDYAAHEPFERGVQEFLQGPVARWLADEARGYPRRPAPGRARSGSLSDVSSERARSLRRHAC